MSLVNSCKWCGEWEPCECVMSKAVELTKGYLIVTVPGDPLDEFHERLDRAIAAALLKAQADGLDYAVKLWHNYPGDHPPRVAAECATGIRARAEGLRKAAKVERCLCGGAGCNSCEPQGRG